MENCCRNRASKETNGTFFFFARERKGGGKKEGDGTKCAGETECSLALLLLLLLAVFRVKKRTCEGADSRNKNNVGEGWKNKRADGFDEIGDEGVADAGLDLLGVVKGDLELCETHDDGVVALVRLEELADGGVDDRVQRSLLGSVCAA